MSGENGTTLRSDPNVLGKGASIRKVTNTGEFCKEPIRFRSTGTAHGKVRVCNRPIVKVELDNGAITYCHDDGSFIEWTGEQVG